MFISTSHQPPRIPRGSFKHDVRNDAAILRLCYIIKGEQQQAPDEESGTKIEGF